DPHGEVVDAIRCARASPWNAAEIAIKEIDGTVRGKVLAGIPDGEFPGAWAPLAGDGGKGVRRVHRRVEPLVFAGDQIGRGHIPPLVPHLGEIAPPWAQPPALIHLHVILEFYGRWPDQPGEIDPIAETIPLRRLRRKVGKAVGRPGEGAPLR